MTQRESDLGPLSAHAASATHSKQPHVFQRIWKGPLGAPQLPKEGSGASEWSQTIAGVAQNLHDAFDVPEKRSHTPDNRWNLSRKELVVLNKITFRFTLNVKINSEVLHPQTFEL